MYTQSTICRKFPKYSDTQKICCNHSKIWTMWLYQRVMSPNDADGMANSVDPDQTAPLGAVWSGSALFASLIRVYTVCQGISVRKLRITTVSSNRICHSQQQNILLKCATVPHGTSASCTSDQQQNATKIGILKFLLLVVSAFCCWSWQQNRHVIIKYSVVDQMDNLRLYHVVL